MMSSYCDVKIAGNSYDEAPKRITCRQTDLFNSADMVSLGTVGDSQMLRAYRIPVSVLRSRLEAIGYSLEHVKGSIIGEISKGYADLDGGFPEYRQFLDYACKLTTEDLIEIVRNWKNTDRLASINFGGINLNNFPDAVIDFMQGDIIDLLPSEEIWLHGLHFERLLCEVYSDEECFEIDFTELVRAGYYDEKDDPIGDSYDKALSNFTTGSFVLGAQLSEHESEVLEYKSVQSPKVREAIVRELKRYVIGFINQKGGRILYGVSDNGLVEGVVLDRESRDKIQRDINAICVDIVPVISLNSIEINFRPLISLGCEMVDKFVLEIVVPVSTKHDMYFSAGGETWVRFGTETRSLKGVDLFTHIRSKYYV